MKKHTAKTLKKTKEKISLLIGGVILAGLMRQDIPPAFLFTVGGIVAILMRKGTI